MHQIRFTDERAAGGRRGGRPRGADITLRVDGEAIGIGLDGRGVVRRADDGDAADPSVHQPDIAAAELAAVALVDQQCAVSAELDRISQLHAGIEDEISLALGRSVDRAV